jgi:hypothetical protein
MPFLILAVRMNVFAGLFAHRRALRNLPPAACYAHAQHATGAAANATEVFHQASAGGRHSWWTASTRILPYYLSAFYPSTFTLFSHPSGRKASETPVDTHCGVRGTSRPPPARSRALIMEDRRLERTCISAYRGLRSRL